MTSTASSTELDFNDHIFGSTNSKQAIDWAGTLEDEFRSCDTSSFRESVNIPDGDPLSMIDVRPHVEVRLYKDGEEAVAVIRYIRGEERRFRGEYEEMLSTYLWYAHDTAFVEYRSSSW